MLQRIVLITFGISPGTFFFFHLFGKIGSTIHICLLKIRIEIM